MRVFSPVRGKRAMEKTLSNFNCDISEVIIKKKPKPKAR